jgi:4-hydroxy-tetrahydrodipicolinate reductase
MISASNFSLGVNLFFELNKKFAKIMEQYPHYKISISEIHHTAKLDAPSGTAITLAEEIIQHNNSYQLWENNKNTAENVLPIESLRIPDVPGTHIIKYTSKEDIIEINHTAINRDGFAAGALIAAEWLIDKKGVYTMKDVLNLN